MRICNIRNLGELIRTRSAEGKGRELFIKDDLTLEGIEGDITLPNHLIVDGNFKISKCNGLINLPNYLRVGRDLNIFDSGGLTSFRSRLHATGLTIQGCQNLSSLPDNLWIECMTLEGCSAITKLPKNLIVDRYLHLINLPNIVSLPTDIYIGGELEIEECRKELIEFCLDCRDNLNIGQIKSVF